MKQISSNNKENGLLNMIRRTPAILCIFTTFLIIVVYSVSMTFIKNEDFIGSYYRVNIRPDIALEICGTAKGILDLKEDEVIICDIDSMIVDDDVIYGICGKGYFLMTLSNREVTYSAGPMSQYSANCLSSPMEYYKKKTMYIDVLGLIVLFLCFIFVIKGWYHKRNLQRWFLPWGFKGRRR
ncbi:hypothetical protein [Prevotella sp. P6B4]|uniref:hypothetical protein n=1 Tax=Prevotella sp. P6B4 TaxID=1410614 RepID=UPI0012DFBF78|nr:hypothetical protein [Prevotella sp. P6B4]